MNSNWQTIADAANGVQQNAQAAVPVVPNNGNPGGAYNMPAWMEPSSNLSYIQEYLNKPIVNSPGYNTGVVPPMPTVPQTQQVPPGRARLQQMGYTGPMPGSPEWRAARASGAHPIRDWMHSQNPEWEMGHPQLPQAPVMPHSGGIVPPMPYNRGNIY